MTDLIRTAFTTAELKEVIREVVHVLYQNDSNIQREHQDKSERWFNLTELCCYLPNKPAKSTIYTKTHLKQIPFHKGVNEKQLRFRKSEIDAWLMNDGTSLIEGDVVGEGDKVLNKYRIGKRKKLSKAC
jgi:predicted DNA-binding transcriptional regulator AlpA